MCVCVCVCVRERERERERYPASHPLLIPLTHPALLAVTVQWQGSLSDWSALQSCVWSSSLLRVEWESLGPLRAGKTLQYFSTLLTKPWTRGGRERE